MIALDRLIKPFPTEWAAQKQALLHADRTVSYHPR
jgi:hypothetical protein